MLLPPNSYRADDRAVVEHYREVAKVGLPVVAYNNPFDTKVDLAPELLAQLYGEGLIVAVKEFTGDVRRVYEIAELAPGSRRADRHRRRRARARARRRRGWVSGYPNAFPKPASSCAHACARRATWPPRCRCTGSCTRCCAGTPRPSSSRRSSCRWTSSGRDDGGPLPAAARPLSPEQEADVREATEKALAAGLTLMRVAAASRSTPSTRTPRACRPGSSPAASASSPAPPWPSGGRTSWSTWTTSARC